MDQGAASSQDRIQIRLLDLIVVVVGAAYVLDVVRRSRPAWVGGWPDLAQSIGLIVLICGVVVGLVVAGQSLRRLRVREGRAWALSWRVAALAWLAAALVELAGSLQAQGVPNSVPPVLRDRDGLHLRLGSLMTMLGMVGLMLASDTVALRPSRIRPRSRLGSWPSLVLATTLGVLMLVLGHALIPYLVLIAVEMVRQAMIKVPLVRVPFLLDRLMTAGIEAVPSLVGCFLTAVWVDDDLRAAFRDPIDARTPRSWRGMVFRFATAIVAVSGSAYVLLVTLPKLHYSLAEGLWTVADPLTVAIVVLGFSTLAAGFAARGAARLATTNENQRTEEGATSGRLGPWPRRIMAGILGLICLEITGAAVQAIYRDWEYHWYLPISLSGWQHVFETPGRLVGIKQSTTGLGLLVDSPDIWLIAIAVVWLTIRLPVLIISREATRPSSLDATASDRLAFGRFLGWWAGLTVVMLASLPGLAIVAVVLFHFMTFWLAS